MSVEIIDELVPKNSQPFPITDVNLIRGGFHQVQTIEERDNIPMGRRKDGMLCFCKEGEDPTESQLFQWNGVTWELANLGGGGIESVETQESLFEIPKSDRFEGMLAYVKENGKTYQLVGGIENEHWVEFSGGGGGGGTVANLDCDTAHNNSGLSEAPIVPAPSDQPVTIPFFFSSPNLGAGTIYIVLTNGGMTKEFTIENVPQTPQRFTFPDPFEKSPSTYNVTMWGVDRTGQQTNKVYIRYQVALLELVTSELNGKVYTTTQNIKFPYSISNGLNEPVKVKEYLSYAGGAFELKNTKTVRNWGSIQYFEVGYLDIPGVYEVKVEVMTEDESTKGNELIRSFLVSSPTIPQVYTDQPEVTFSTDEVVRLKYRTAMAGKKELRVRGYKVFDDGSEEYLMQRDVPTIQENEWVISDALMPGTHYFRLYVQTIPVGEDTTHGDRWAEFTVHITQGNFVPMTPVEEGMIAQFLVKGDTDNNSPNRNQWINTRNIEEGPHISLHNLNYTSVDGWHIGGSQEDMYLRLMGRGYGIFDYKPFEKDHDRNGGEEIKGWTFEMLYRANNVGNEEARVLSCTPPNASIPGVYVDMQDASIATKAGAIATAVETDEWTHVTFVIHRDYRQEKDTSGAWINVSFMFIYINGVINRVDEIGNIDTTSFEHPYNMLLNATLNEFGQPDNFGSCDIREIRVYNRALEGDEIVRNYISTVKDPEAQKKEIEMNERGSQIPVLTVNRRTIGVDDKGNPILEPFGRTEDKNKIRCHVEYNSQDELFGSAFPSDLKTYPTSQIYYQGNSSLIYAKKNYKLRLRRFKDSDYVQGEDGELMPPMTDDGYVDPTDASKWKWSPIPIGKETTPEGYKHWIAEDTFTLKTDYMESSHASNPGSARYIHDLYRTGSVKRLTPPQKANMSAYVQNQDLLRSTVDGFPVRMILDGVDEGIFIMLVDKNSVNTFGLKPYEREDGSEIFPLCQSFEISANSDIGAGAFRVTDLEAVQREFEPRLAPPSSYKDNLDGTEKNYTFDENAWYATNADGVFDEQAAKKATPHHLLRLITWVKETGEAYEAGIKKRDLGIQNEDATMKEEGEREAQAALTIFKNKIQGVGGKPDYFDEGYLIDYYLFALTFGMVDNFGKNTFLNTWDGRIWYLGFYDMDSMLGIDNQGKRNRDVDLEIDDKDEVGGYHFNTSQSLLWVLTRNAFSDEIKARYKELRELNFFSFETASKYYLRDFMEKIPKRDYNRDALHKYLNVSKAERASYLEICSGDRKTYVSRWIKKRIIFMDSLMNYTGEYFNEQIALRANLEQPGWIEIPLKTFSPQYVSIEFTTGNIVREKCYPDRETIFRGYIATQTNQEINIGNAEFIKEIGNVKHLRISEAYLENAVRLNKFDCSGSQMLKSLNIGPLRYLRELNCSGCSNLGASGGVQRLDLSECDNLMYLNASSTKLVSILLPKNGSPLVDLNVTNCPKLETLKVVNQINLTQVPLDGCESLSEISFTSCTNLTSFKLPVLSGGKISRLSDVSFSNCPKIESLTFEKSATLRFLNLYKLTNLRSLTLKDMSRNDGVPDENSIQVCLDLSQGLDQLEELTMTNCNVDSVRFARLSNNPLRTLILNKSNISKIHYGSNGEVNDHLNFEGLQNLETFEMSGCQKAIQVSHLNYTKNNPNQPFRDCYNLEDLSGNLKFSGNIDYLCNNCRSLMVFPTMDLSEATDAYRSFSQCNKMIPTEIPKIVQMFYQASSNKQSQMRTMKNTFEQNPLQEDETPIEPPSLLFDSAKFPYLTELSATFHHCKKMVGKLPGDFFGRASSTSSLTSISSLFKYSTVTGFHDDLLKPLKNLVRVTEVFNNTLEEQEIPENFFDNCSKVTHISKMFYSNSGIVGSVKARWFEKMPNLVDASLMFYNCPNLGSTVSNQFPANLFVHNKKLENISGMFYKCRSMGGSLPESLLGGDSLDSDQRMALKYASAAFAETGIEGEVPARLLRWCPELLEVGSYSWSHDASYPNSNDNGIFGKTNLTAQLPTDDEGNSIFRYNTKLQKADGVFKECTKLNTKIPARLFYNNQELTTLANFFYGCPLVNGEVPNTLFQRTKKLTTLLNFFRGVKGLTGAFPESLFEGLNRVKDLRYFFSQCKLMGPSIPTNIFRGMTSLERVDYFFENCDSITSAIPAPVYRYEQIGEEESPEEPGVMIPIHDWVLKEKGLFEDCPNLSTARGFLKECRNVRGMLPEFLFRKNEALTDLAEFFYNNNRIEGSIPARFFEKNKNLLTISHIFYHCNRLGGYLPTGLFAKNVSLNNISYAFAWVVNLEKYPTDDILTCVPSDLFANCPIVEAEGTFERCGKLTGTIPPLFSFKSQLKNVARAFCYTKVTGPVTDNFMNNCTMLERMECLFEGCTGLTSISKNLLTNDMNVVKDARHCLYGCSGVSGEVPTFQYQPSVNKKGAYADMNSSAIANWDQVKDFSTAELYHADIHRDPYRDSLDEYED